MRFHTRSYQTLPAVPDGRVHGDFSTYIPQLRHTRRRLPPHLRRRGRAPRQHPLTNRCEPSSPATTWSIYSHLSAVRKPQNESSLRADKRSCSRDVEIPNLVIYLAPLFRPLSVLPWSPWAPMTPLTTSPPLPSRILHRQPQPHPLIAPQIVHSLVEH